MASIHDIAQRAGVSIATVSRVLNGSAGVRKDKSERVMEALKYFNWQPSQLGRGLRTKSSGMIGLVAPSSEIGMYTSQLLRGAGMVAASHGYSVAIIFSDVSQDGMPGYLALAQQHKIDGLIFSIPPSTDETIHAMGVLEKEGFPVVYVGKKATTYGSNVYAKYEDYTIAALEYLYSMNHRKILLPFYNVHAKYVERAVGEMKARHADLRIECVEYAAADKEAFFHTLTERYVVEGGCTAITNVDSENISVLIGQLACFNLSVPEDLSVIVTDNSGGNGCRDVYPGYTANMVPSESLGRGAAELLFGMLTSGDMTSLTREYETELVIRNSVRRF